jgi:hypothetical protein
MGKWRKRAVFGLLWLTFAASAFAGDTVTSAQSVPEAATLALTGAGLLLVGLLRKRKNGE